MIDKLFPDVPRPAVWLGLAGLIPFFACAAASYLLPPAWTGKVLLWMLGYGAVILSFLGGVHWGLATGGYGVPVPARSGQADPALSMTWTRLGWSVVPSIAAWAAFLLPLPIFGLVLLTAAFATMLIGDIRAVAEGLAPDWYLNLRANLSRAVVLALLATWVPPVLGLV